MKPAHLVAPLLALASFAAVALPTCSGGQLPYKVDYAPMDFSGNTPEEACTKNGAAYGNNYWAILPDGRCEVGWSGSGDSHAMLHICEAAGTTPPTTGDQLSGEFIAKILATYFGVWAMGFGIGKSVAWTRALGSAG